MSNGPVVRMVDSAIQPIAIFLTQLPHEGKKKQWIWNSQETKSPSKMLNFNIGLTSY